VTDGPSLVTTRREGERYCPIHTPPRETSGLVYISHTTARFTAGNREMSVRRHIPRESFTVADQFLGHDQRRVPNGMPWGQGMGPSWYEVTLHRQSR
jgi:hypothetical protein